MFAHSLPPAQPLEVSMSKFRLFLVGIGAVLVILLFLPGFTTEVWSGWNCGTLAFKGFLPIAKERATRFQGKVQKYTAVCRGAGRPLATRSTPWVDWSNYWGAGDETSKALFRSPLNHLGPNGRGVDGALIDLEYQRIELLTFNL